MRDVTCQDSIIQERKEIREKEGKELMNKWEEKKGQMGGKERERT